MAYALIVTLALAAAPVGQPAEIAASEAQQAAPQQEVVQTSSDRNQRLTVPVMIEGEGPFEFMVDTGSEATVVTDRLRDQLAFASVGNAIVVGMASRVPVELVRLDGLEFAARVFDGLEAPLLEARHVGADGILGLNALQDLRVLIDFRQETIAVDDAANLGGNRGYEIVIRARRKLGQLIITDAVIDNVRTAVVIDTGAQTSMGNLALQNKLRARKGEAIRSTDVNGFEIVGSVDFARTLRMGEMQISDLPILFSDSPAFRQLGLSDRPAMILGMRDMRGFDRVAIDFASRTILLDMPKAARARQRPLDDPYLGRM